jgi:hypothetical protein
LAEHGIELTRKGTGAVFVIDGKTVNASINRRTSHDAIVKRFGQPLTPSPYPITNREPRERWPGDSQRQAYYAARRPHDERLKLAIADVQTALGTTGRSGAVAAALKASMSAAAFPAFEAWRRGAPAPDPTELVLGAVQLSEIAGPSGPRGDPLPAALEGYRATQLTGRVVYRAIADARGRPAFVDLGNKILVHAGNNRDAVRASLLLIASRYPDHKIAVTGDGAFQRLVLEIANEEQIQLDGVLGRRQTRHITDVRCQPPLASARRTDIVASQAASMVKPIPAAPATRRGSPLRVLAMLGRVFHSGDWLASEYWSVAEGREVPARAPTRTRSLEGSRLQPSVPPSPRQPSPADLARRAAAIAAATRNR